MAPRAWVMTDLTARLSALEQELRAEGERCASFHATMGTGYTVAADRLALLLGEIRREEEATCESRSTDGDGPSNAISQLINVPRWKCRQCGCLWRDNLDGSVSLFDANQKSCQNCEMLPTAESCVIEWFKSHAEPQALYDLLNQAKDALAAVLADCDTDTLVGLEPADSLTLARPPQPPAPEGGK
jgi:hypothetical protein